MNTIKKICYTFFFLLSITIPSSQLYAIDVEADALKSSVNLALLDSKSSVTIPLPLPPSPPPQTTFFLINNTFYAGRYQQKFVGDLLISGYAHHPYITALTPTGTNAILPAFIIHDTSANTLNEKGRLTLPAGVGIISVQVSPVSTRPYLVVSRISPTTTGSHPPFPGSIIPTGPYDYVIEIYKYNPDGTIVQTPIDTLVWGVDYNPPELNTTIITYNVGVSFSHDGKYLFYTYTSGEKDVSLSEHLGAFEILPNGKFKNKIPEAETTLPRGPFPGFNPAVDGFFPIPEIKTFIPPNSSIYKMVVGLVGFKPGTLDGVALASLLNSYDFNPAAHTLTPTGSQPLPQNLRGEDINKDGDRVVVITANSDENGIAVTRLPRPPYQGDIPEKGKSFRVYNFDKGAASNALTYVLGHDFGSAAGLNLRFSSGGDLLALTMAPQLAMTSIALPPTFAVAPAFGSSVLASFSFDKAAYQFVLQDVQPASLASLGIAWKVDDTRLATQGSPSPTLHDIQLYKVTRSE